MPECIYSIEPLDIRTIHFSALLLIVKYSGAIFDGMVKSVRLGKISTVVLLSVYVDGILVVQETVAINNNNI